MEMRPFLRKIRIAFALAAIALAAFALVSYAAISRLLDFHSRLDEARNRLVQVERMNSSMSRSATKLRNFVLSGRQGDLDQFEAMVAEEIEAANALRRSGRGADQDTLEHAMQQRRTLQHQVAALRIAGNVDDATALVISPELEGLGARAGDALDRIRADQRQSWLDAHVVPTVRRAQQAVIGAVVLLCLILGWVWWVVRRYEQERQRVTTRLGESEAMTRVLAANIADGLLTVGEDMRVVGINPAAALLLGYEDHEVIGRHVAELLGPDAQGAGYDELLQSLLAECAPFKLAGVELEGLHKDGHRIPLQVSVGDVNLRGRRLVCSLLRDMSAAKAAAEAVQASEQHLREIADTLPVIVIEIDLQGRFRFHNRALEDFLGRAYEAVCDRPVSEVLDAELFAAHKPYLELALQGTASRYEVKARDADGELRSFAMNLIPRRDRTSHEVVGLYAFANDITELKRIDRMKTEFISTVSHELRTPLTSIRGSLGLVAGGVAGKVPEAAGHLLGIAQANCDRLIRLIGDILDIEKIEAGKLPLRLSAVEILPVVQQAIADNTGFAREEGVSLVLQAIDEPLTVRVDTDRLLQVLTNLISNAVKFSPPRAPVEVRVWRNHDAVRVEVADRGLGVPLEFQRRMFQKFSQADASDTRRKGGTGLGLAISKTLVEKMGGQIGFTSTPGAGATFYFELPRWVAPVWQRTEPAPLAAHEDHA